MKLQKLAPWNWFKKEQDEYTQIVNNKNELSPLTDDFNTHPIEQLQSSINQLFNGFLSVHNPVLNLPGEKLKDIMLKPNLNIKEDSKKYVISVEIPGVEQDNINLELNNNVLTISGEKKIEEKNEQDNYHCIERSYGYFKRVVSLPSDADSEKIDATFKNGVLDIKLPKLPSKQQPAKKISIKNQQ